MDVWRSISALYGDGEVVNYNYASVATETNASCHLKMCK